MSSIMESSLCVLPPEVICHIISFLSPQDVIRLRAVSKQYYDLTYDHEIWRTLYTNAQLPRPPGPFPSQSLQFLEHTLVQSERLAHSWTTQPMGDFSSVRSRYAKSRIIYGKWLISCESSSKFVVHDFDSNAGLHSQQILWESASPIHSWDACSVVFTSALLMHIMFCATINDLVPWKLLEFRVNGDSLHHTLTLDVPTKKESGNPVYLDGGRSPFLYIVGQRLIFDAETRSFYGFPEFKSALVGGDQTSATSLVSMLIKNNVKVSSDSHFTDRIPRVILLTKTHIICLFRNADHMIPIAPSSLIQAFTVPADPRPGHNGTDVLRLSHEGVAPGLLLRLHLIRNSIVDAVSGATSIRLLHQYFDGANLHFSCLDLTLPKHSSTDTALPMNIDLHDIAHVHSDWSGLYRTHICYVESSDDGHVRGFCRFLMAHDASSGNLRANYPTMRFTIDASRDKCVAVFGRILVPQWREIDDPPEVANISFDGVRGRLCCRTMRYIPGQHESAAVVIMIDIK